MVATYLIYLLLFFLPLLVFPFGRLIFEPPKAVVAQVLIELLVLYFLFTGKLQFKKINKNLLVLLGGVVLLSVIHLLLNPTPHNLFGNQFRLQGNVLLWHLLALTITAQLFYFRLKDRYIYLASFLIICLFGIGIGVNSAGRFIGTLGEPNALASVIVFTFPFAFLNFHKTARILLAVFALLIINYTESKSGLVGLGVVLLFILLVENFKVKIKKALIICLILMITSLGLPFLEREYWISANADPYKVKFEDRAEIWKTAFYTGLDSPLIGSGFGSVQEKLNETSKKLNNTVQYQVVDSSHNFLLDFWVQGGLIGLGLILTLIILTLINMAQKGHFLELTAYLGVLIAMLFNPVTITILIAFYFLTGRSFAKAEN